ncbi:MAG: YebC/PmpR family DNA-binding transcriptional regulator [Acidobacteriota bacterium]|jgi:YebC/PmpR family DNA-binding regulatory protein
MSGHSKWSTIKHKKAAADAKRGQVFTRIIREITVAARQGGGDPEGNPRLRTAVNAARAANMPKDNIEKAIKKGTGELPGVTFEEVVYEGYGPAGVAFYVEAMTDNKNRTLPEIRHLFTKKGGNLAESNSVAWIFEKKGFLVVSGEDADEETLLETVLDAGAEDVREEGDHWEIYSPPDSLGAVSEALQAAGITPQSASVEMIPQNSVRCEGEQARKVLNMMDALEEHDDVQNVWANFDIDDEILAERG